jgi:hypothetical protein
MPGATENTQNYLVRNPSNVNVMQTPGKNTAPPFS